MRLGGCRTGFRDLSVRPPGGGGRQPHSALPEMQCPDDSKLPCRNWPAWFTPRVNSSRNSGTNDPQSTLRVLLLGYGLAGRVFHAPLIGATEGMEITAVVTGDPGRQAQAQTDLPGARLVSTADEAWDVAEFDLAVVAGANITHVPQARTALERGMHVVVDKPLAPDAASAQALADLALATEQQLHIFQNRRWDSDYLTLLEVVASGRLGTPHRLESRFERLRTQLSGNWRESAQVDDQGGVLVDFGAHLVDQALALLGPVVTVTASARSVRAADIANDDAQMLLTHTSGAVSYLSGSSVAAFGQPRFLLLGTNGGCRIDRPDSQEAQLREGLTPRDAEFGTESLESSAVVQYAEPDGTLHEQQWPRATGAWHTYYAAVRDAIELGTPAPVPVTDVIANLRVLDAAAESARTAATITLDPPAGHAGHAAVTT